MRKFLNDRGSVCPEKSPPEISDYVQSVLIAFVHQRECLFDHILVVRAGKSLVSGYDQDAVAASRYVLIDFGVIIPAGDVSSIILHRMDAHGSDTACRTVTGDWYITDQDTEFRPV